MIFYFSLLTAGVYGAVATYFVNHNLSLGAVRASAIISLTGVFISFLLNDIVSEELAAIVPAVIMGASFIGMASKTVGKGWKTMILSGIFFSFVFISTGTFFNGFGGSLGTTAAIALGATLGFRYIIYESKVLAIKK
jgi:hypothetical protein